MLLLAEVVHLGGIGIIELVSLYYLFLLSDSLKECCKVSLFFYTTQTKVFVFPSGLMHFCLKVVFCHSYFPSHSHFSSRR